MCGPLWTQLLPPADVGDEIGQGEKRQASLQGDTAATHIELRVV